MYHPLRHALHEYLIKVQIKGGIPERVADYGIAGR